MKFANSVLDKYSNWRNGDVHGVCVEVFHKPDEADEDWARGGDDACWGYIGHKYAEQTMQSEFTDATAPKKAGPTSPEPSF